MQYADRKLDYMERHLTTPLASVLPIMQAGILGETSYFGIRTYKSPMDAWVYQEIIHDQMPDVIVEIGNKWGGSTLMMAHWLDHLGHGRLIAVDHDHSRLDQQVLDHQRIHLVTGLACDVAETVARMIRDDETVMVVEDSEHTYENTLGVLRRYSPLVRPGGYFIIEDSIANHGLDRRKKWPRGPYEAVRTFLKENGAFEADRTREHFFLTWNPMGYLRRRVG